MVGSKRKEEWARCQENSIVIDKLGKSLSLSETSESIELSGLECIYNILSQLDNRKASRDRNQVVSNRVLWRLSILLRLSVSAAWDCLVHLVPELMGDPAFLPGEDEL